MRCNVELLCAAFPDTALTRSLDSIGSHCMGEVPCRRTTRPRADGRSPSTPGRRHSGEPERESTSLTRAPDADSRVQTVQFQRTRGMTDETAAGQTPRVSHRASGHQLRPWTPPPPPSLLSPTPRRHICHVRNACPALGAHNCGPAWPRPPARMEERGN